MEGFSEFVRGFCIIAVSGGLVLLISPDGNLKKYVKFAISLCMICALMSAFISFSDAAEGYISKIETESEKEESEMQGDLRESVVKQAKKNMEAELISLLSAKLCVPREDIYVVAELDTSDLAAVEITAVNVFLADTEKAEMAERYLAEIFMGAVKINIMQKGE